MAKDYSAQLSALLITLSNINDHLRNIEDKISAKSTSEPQVFKHIIAIKSNPKTKENQNGKIPR